MHTLSLGSVDGVEERGFLRLLPVLRSHRSQKLEVLDSRRLDHHLAEHLVAKGGLQLHLQGVAAVLYVLCVLDVLEEGVTGGQDLVLFKDRRRELLREQNSLEEFGA